MLGKSLAALLLSAGLLAPEAAMAAYQCTAAETGQAEDLAPAPKGFDDPRLGSTLAEAVARLRNRHLPPGRIVDRLVGDYCRQIRPRALSDALLADQVRRFASRVVGIVYGSPAREQDIVVDVPVPTRTFDALHRAARKAGVSDEAWVNTAIVHRLGAE